MTKPKDEKFSEALERASSNLQGLKALADKNAEATGEVVTVLEQVSNVPFGHELLGYPQLLTETRLVLYPDKGGCAGCCECRGDVHQRPHGRGDT